MTVQSKVYSPPQQSVVTLPEQALCDFIYSMRRRGVAPESQVTFRKLDGLDRTILFKIAQRYPGTVQKNLQRIIIESGKSR